MFRRALPLLLVLLPLLVAAPALAAGPVYELTQDPEVVLRHQRLVGNVRAKAQRQGIIRYVPQLFVYHVDRTPVFHMPGRREGWPAELRAALESFWVERTTVDLATLLSRARDADGERLEVDDLPDGAAIAVFYRREDCEACERVEQALTGFAENLERWPLAVVRITL